MDRQRVDIVDIDLGWDEINRRLEDIKDGAHVDIGFMQSGNVDTPATLDVIQRHAYINEFGHEPSNIPPRPANRTAFDERVGDYEAMLRDTVYSKPEDMDFEETLREIGDEARLELKSQIAVGDWEPNRPFTVEKKGFDDPLIETFEMLDSVGVRYEED